MNNKIEPTGAYPRLLDACLLAPTYRELPRRFGRPKMLAMNDDNHLSEAPKMASVTRSRWHMRMCKDPKGKDPKEDANTETMEWLKRNESRSTIEKKTDGVDQSKNKKKQSRSTSEKKTLQHRRLKTHKNLVEVCRSLCVVCACSILVLSQ